MQIVEARLPLTALSGLRSGTSKVVLWPERGVMALPGEIVQARHVRYVGLRTEAGAEHEIARTRNRAIA
jgi:hypothetical protein